MTLRIKVPGTFTDTSLPVRPLPSVPGQVTGLTAGTATQTAQPLTWTATPDADSYEVQYKAASSGTWLDGPEPTAPNATVTALTAATSYDYRVRAINDIGAGAWSAVVTNSTATALTVLASDSLNGTDTSSIAGRVTDSYHGGTAFTWASSGQIGITGNAAKRQPTPTSVRFSDIPLAVADAFVEAPVVLSDTGDLALTGRKVDASNYYRAFAAANGSVYLGKTVAGSSTILSGTLVTSAIASGGKLGLRIVGSLLQVLVNGVVISSATDTALTAAGNWGLCLPASTVPAITEIDWYAAA